LDFDSALTRADNSPASASFLSADMESVHGNFSPMTAKRRTVSSSLSTADNTPTNSDDDPVLVHARVSPFDSHNQQQLMKLRASGQAVMLELQSKTDFESSRPTFLPSPKNSEVDCHQFGVSTLPCHSSEFGMRWLFQPVY